MGFFVPLCLKPFYLLLDKPMRKLMRKFNPEKQVYGVPFAKLYIQKLAAIICVFWPIKDKFGFIFQSYFHLCYLFISQCQFQAKYFGSKLNTVRQRSI